MKIAVSGDWLNVFTSSYPARGMLLELIKLRKNDLFVIFYTQRPKSEVLTPFFTQLHSQPNVQIRFFKGNRHTIGLMRFLSISSYFQIDQSFDIYINPCNIEYIRDYKGPQICNVTDLSILHSQASIPHPTIWKWQNKFSKSFYFKQKNLQIVSISHFTKQDILKSFSEVNCTITVVHNGIDKFWFDGIYANNNVTEKYLSESYFIWWGYISKRKNLINLIAAYKQAIRTNPHLPKLMIVGDIAPNMEQSIKPLLTNEYIIYLPFQDEYILKTLVQRSRGLLFPSNYEGFGLPVIEAFSQGTPVACSDVTSLPEVADNKALLFPPSDIEKMKDAILEMANPIDERKQKELIDYAHNFTYRKAALAYNELIEHIRQ